MSNNDFQILKNFHEYAKSESNLVQQSNGVSFNGELIKNSRSSEYSTVTKYSKTRPQKTRKKADSLISYLVIEDKSVIVGGNFPEKEVYKIPDGYSVVYKGINKIGTTSEDFMVNLIIREDNTDNYKILNITENSIIEKNISLPVTSVDEYIFKNRLSNTTFQHGFLSGYDISELKEQYTEIDENLLSQNMPGLGYGLLVYRNGHIINRTPIILQLFNDPIYIDEGLDGDFERKRTLPPVLTIDEQNFTITKTKSYVGGKLKTIITKTTGSVSTDVFQKIEDEIVPENFEPNYTYSIIRNPPFVDDRSPQCALSGFNSNILVVNGKRNKDYDYTSYYISPPSSFIEGEPYIEITTTEIPPIGNVAAQFQTSYIVYYDVKPPYTIFIGGFYKKGFIVASNVLETEYLMSPGVVYTNGVSIDSIEVLYCERPNIPAQPYESRQKIESYHIDILKNEDITLSDPIFNIKTNLSLPDVEIIKSENPPTGDLIKNATITPTYPLTIPITLPDQSLNIKLRNKEIFKSTYDLSISDMGFPQSGIIRNGKWGFGDIGSPEEGGDTVIESGDTIYFQNYFDIGGYATLSHDIEGNNLLSGGWEIGLIIKTKQIEIEAGEIICIGDRYSLIKQFDPNIEILLGEYELISEFVLSGDFKYAEKNQIVKASKIKPNTKIVQASKTSISLTDNVISSGSSIITAYGESTYIIENRVYNRRKLFTPNNLFPENDIRNNTFVFDLSIGGKPNLIDKTLYIITKINDDQTAECLGLDLSKSEPRFFIFDVQFTDRTSFQDISVIE